MDRFVVEVETRFDYRVDQALGLLFYCGCDTERALSEAAALRPRMSALPPSAPVCLCLVT